MDTVWEMSLGQFVAYYKELPEVLKLTNPWGGGGDTAPLSTSPRGSVGSNMEPKQVLSAFVNAGVKIKTEKK